MEFGSDIVDSTEKMNIESKMLFKSQNNFSLNSEKETGSATIETFLGANQT